MPKSDPDNEIKPNALEVRSKLKGGPAVYRIHGIPGLHLAVLSSGRGRYRLRYRDQRKKQHRWHTIGDAQIVELRDAIAKARELLAGLQVDGIDPKAAADREARAQLTFDGAYREWLDHPGRKKKLRARTRDEYERLYGNHIEHRLSDVKIALLDRATVKTALEEIRRATTDAKRGQRGLQATKALAVIKAVCRYAVAQEYSDKDPTMGIERPVPVANPDGRQHRPPTNDELRQLWHGAEAVSPKSKRPYMEPKTRRVFKLAVLLGKRVSELAGARKSEVELGENANLFIPGTREGNKSREDQRVPLAPLAQKLIEESIATSIGSPYLFPGDTKKRAQTLKTEICMSRHTPSHALHRLRSELGIAENVRLHDMRGLIVDQLAALQVPSEYRSHVLHHTGDMRSTLAAEVYSTYDFLAEKRRALELWEKRLLEIIDNKKPTGLRW